MVRPRTVPPAGDSRPVADGPAPARDAAAWHAATGEEVLAALGSGAQGLAADEAAERLRRDGPNVLARQRADGPLALLWRQIDNPLIWVLIGSAAVAVALGKPRDGLVVLAVVVLNTIIGFVQEHRAGKAIEALSSMVPERVNVLRGGRQLSVASADLVRGDVVLLASGDKVPADIRLLAVKNLQAEEAALTGESVPVRKHLAPVAPDAALGDRESMCFGGTLITTGTATGVVVATGGATELGRIATMLRETVDLETPLTRALHVIGRGITIAILVLAAVMLAIGTLRAVGHGQELGEALRESLLFAIALAVGAIPEGLPAIVTIALAIGVQRMAARRAIIRKLPAVETLGSTTVICSDKTGTLTRNEMTVVRVWTPVGGACTVGGVGYAPAGGFARGGQPEGEAPTDVERLLRDAVLCNDASLHHEGGAWHVAGDPTEGALVVAAAKAALQAEALRRAYPRLDVVPFESEHQFMATLHAEPEGERRIVLKGAPEVVLRRCAGEVDAATALRLVDEMAHEGMRVLAVAEKAHLAADGHLHEGDVEAGFRLVGLVGMIDPPRPEAIEAVAACQRAGIAVKMITGDHHATAFAIGRQLGLARDGGAALTGAELASMDDPRLRAAARDCHVFARVAPEHKLRLVRALQHEGQVVAMTGDGVNDAPALKQANIGVAMGITGTSVSKEAADVVLADDNFASIRAAVEEGRRVYDNLVKSLAFVLPTNLGLALILVAAVVAFPFDPVTGELLLPVEPIQLLWINLVTTVALALPLAFESPEPDVMRRPPRDPAAPVLSRFVVVRTVLAGALMAAGGIGLFLWEYRRELAAAVAADVALREAQTMAVTAVVLFQIFYLLNCRSLRDSLRAIGVFSNRAVLAGIAVLLALQAAFVYLPPMHALFGTTSLQPADLGTAAVVAASILPVIGLEKWLRRRGR